MASDYEKLSRGASKLRRSSNQEAAPASKAPLLKQEGQPRVIVFDRERRGGRLQRIDWRAFEDDFCVSTTPSAPFSRGHPSCFRRGPSLARHVTSDYSDRLFSPR